MNRSQSEIVQRNSVIQKPVRSTLSNFSIESTKLNQAKSPMKAPAVSKIFTLEEEFKQDESETERQKTPKKHKYLFSSILNDDDNISFSNIDPSGFSNAKHSNSNSQSNKQNSSSQNINGDGSRSEEGRTEQLSRIKTPELYKSLAKIEEKVENDDQAKRITMFFESEEEDDPQQYNQDNILNSIGERNSSIDSFKKHWGQYFPQLNTSSSSKK